ncbi:hypothetical protein AOQ88_01535 [Candidatus Riesia sp. GBBU]|nr:hypothetical protein AOQ88_01535 [Candidatus Riesia sp. GBBU]
MKKFALFGNPIQYSKSPFVHRCFSRQTGEKYSYKKILATHENFDELVFKFFREQGFGANITAPFKEMAYKIIDEKTNVAKICKSVNTIKLMKNKKLLGDNSDGIGLITDLKRLCFIRNGMNVLVIGAGGTARSIVFSILKQGCKVVITNRTIEKAELIAKNFRRFGEISVLKQNYIFSKQYDLVINATSSEIENKAPDIPYKIFNENVFCYDIFYKKIDTKFLEKVKKMGVLKYSDGIGMLVSQAAFSFKLWYEYLPNINSVIRKLRK